MENGGISSSFIAAWLAVEEFFTALTDFLRVAALTERLWNDKSRYDADDDNYC